MDGFEEHMQNPVPIFDLIILKNWKEEGAFNGIALKQPSTRGSVDGQKVT